MTTIICPRCDRPVLADHDFFLVDDVAWHLDCVHPEAKPKPGPTIVTVPQTESGNRWDGVVMKDDDK